MSNIQKQNDQYTGCQILNPIRKAAWRSFILKLHEASLPGEPLSGWLFHGIPQSHIPSIKEDGIHATKAIIQDPPDKSLSDGAGGSWRSYGSHWAVPKVAAFYAEDWITKTDDPNIDLALVAVRIDDLRSEGHFVVDGQTLDEPIFTRLDRPEKEIRELWSQSDQDWQACLDLFGTLLVLAPIGPENIRIIRNMMDLDQLLSELTQSKG